MLRDGLQLGKKGPLAAERLLVVAGACAALGACAAPFEANEEQHHVGRAIQPIVGGITSGTSQDAVVALARFANGARVGLCTATLVAPNLVVTARHCVSATDATAACGADGKPVAGAMLHGDRAPATLAVYAASGGLAPDTTAEAGASAHGKALVVDGATTICNHDLAFVILDVALGAPIAPVRLGAPTMTEALTAVGFGITEAGALPARRMQRSGLALVGAGPMVYPDDARYGVGDGELLVGESACSGDSGGPVLSASGAVLGVASRAGNGKPRDPNNAASTCTGATAHAVYAELGANVALATRAFKEAGATPWLEGQPDPRSAKNGPPAGGPSPGSSGASSGGDHAPSAPPPDAINPADAPAAASGDGPTNTAASAGGCSASSEPTHGAVEHALGFVALVLLVLRFRGARRRRADEQANATDAERRVPYVDLGMRESFASLSDER